MIDGLDLGDALPRRLFDAIDRTPLDGSAAEPNGEVRAVEKASAAARSMP